MWNPMGQKTRLISISQDTDRDLFNSRVKEQAEKILSNSDNFSPKSHGFGLEREYYVIDEDGNLTRCQNSLFEDFDIQRELGIHNFELACEPTSQILGDDDIIECLRDNIQQIQQEISEQHVVREGLLSVTPEDYHADDYLSECEEIDGYSVNQNMTQKPYYILLDYDLSDDKNKSLSNPNTSYRPDGLMPVSLTTSIQPHIQIPRIEDIEPYFSAALRICGPVLSISTNSPFLPPSMYDKTPDTDPYTHENRVVIQNDLLNDRDRTGARFPRDIESFEDMINRVSEHELFMPILSEDAPSVDWDEEYHEFNHQQRTTWWWVNPRIGDSIDDNSGAVRMELRPFPNQPTFEDNISLFSLLVGSIVEIAECGHPVLDLEWNTARLNFENAVSDGPNADLFWIDKNGNRLNDNNEIIKDIIGCARRGLNRIESDTSGVDEVLKPMIERGQCSPSSWKVSRYETYLNNGYEYQKALEMTFEDYVEACHSGSPFYQWQRFQDIPPLNKH